MLIRHDRSDRATLVDPADWPALTSIFRGHGGASLIAPRWLLTAGHVAQAIPLDRHLSVKFLGQRYAMEHIVIHPTYRPEWVEEDEEDGHNVVDLALIELANPVDAVQPLGLYEGSSELGQEVILLGAGECGNGRRGTLGSDRHLRRVTNRVDEVDAFWLKFRFDEPPEGTDLEGVCGHGDSGGPALIQQDGQLLLAGISSWQQTGDRPLGTYGCVEHYARVSVYLDWIREVCGA